MSNKNLNKQMLELKALREEKALLIAKNEALEKRVKSVKTKRLKFRIESTKTSNSFHIAVNEIFLDVEAIKTEHENLYVSYDEELNEYVFKSDLRDVLKAKLQKLLE